jgi:hypothetical protein
MITEPRSRSLYFPQGALKSLVLACFGLCLTANAANPIPLVNQPLIPEAVAPGGAGFTLTVNGTGFVSGATVNWNSSPRATVFLSASQLTASILESDIATAGTASITVANPSPGGGISNVVFFPVTAPTSSVSLNRSDYATGSIPDSVVSADFNGDGILDLAVANFGDNTISIFVGYGDGTFQSRVNYATGSNPSRVAVGDFNKDDKMDIAVADGAGSSGNTVSVLLGNGDGTFQSHVDYQTGRGSVSVAVADINRDGNLDLSVGNYGPDYLTGSVSILLGNGDGTFQAHMDYPAGVNPVGVLVGDFNQDNELDLGVMNNNPPFGVSTLLGNGDGSFQKPIHNTAGTNPRAGIVADFNADGNLDLAIGNWLDNNFSILSGKGDGIFQPPVNYRVGNNPNGIMGGDMDGDGHLDLVTVNYTSNTLSIMIGDGDGTFQPHTDYPTDVGPSQSAVGDLNRDGLLDVVVTNQIANTLSVLLQAPPATDCLPPPSGLVSWWSGDKTAGDVQGANNGVLKNGASFRRGLVGQAFRFDGIDDGVRIPDSPSLSHARITVDAWIYQTGNQNMNTRIVGKDDPAVVREYSLGIVGPNNVTQGFVNLLPSSFPIVTGTTIIQLNTWYHIAMTHDGLKLRLYVNGIQEGVVDAVGDIVPTSAPGVIGSDPFGDFFKGSIDEAQIFDRALTDAEILAIYQAGAAGQCKPEIFVASIDPTYTTSGHGFRISTSVVIQDENGIATSNATVQLGVELPSGSVLNFSVKTDLSGQAALSFTAGDTGLYRFKVQNVTGPGREYDRALNAETKDTLVIP